MNQYTEKLHTSLPGLQSRYPIAKMAIFGSQARGDAGKDSDIDILVSFHKPIGIEFIDLAEELEALLNKKVDLITFESLKPRHWDYIKDEIIYVE